MTAHYNVRNMLVALGIFAVSFGLIFIGMSVS